MTTPANATNYRFMTIHDNTFHLFNYYYYMEFGIIANADRVTIDFYFYFFKASE